MHISEFFFNIHTFLFNISKQKKNTLIPTIAKKQIFNIGYAIFTSATPLTCSYHYLAREIYSMRLFDAIIADLQKIISNDVETKRKSIADAGNGCPLLAQ